MKAVRYKIRAVEPDDEMWTDKIDDRVVYGTFGNELRIFRVRERILQKLAKIYMKK